MLQRITIAAVTFALLIPALAWGLGADHPRHAISNSNWPTGLAKLVNAEQRVHGYFVNAEDVLFFRGATADLNDFLKKYAALSDAKLEVVIHAGQLEVKSPWDETPRDMTADWRLYVAPFERDPARATGVKPGRFVTRIDVWLGGNVKLDDLHVPKHVAVKSGGEIEAFVKAHREG